MRVPPRATGGTDEAWEVASHRPERTRARATRSSPAARTLGEETAIRGPYRRAGPQRRWLNAVSGRSAAALLPDPLLQHDRGADEAELLPQPPLDVALVRRLQLAAGEEHEHRRLGRGLGAEHDLRLLAAADRVRVLGDQAAEEGVERAGRDPG